MRYFYAHAILSMVFLTILAAGCSNSSGNPLTPDNGMTGSSRSSENQSQTHLWGFYDIYIDTQSKEVSAVINRNAMFSVNVVKFLNQSVAGLGFKIYDTPVDPAGKFIDIDIDVKLTHPFAGLPQYNGYDVRGIFLGDGSSVMAYNPSLIYAKYNSTDQVMYDYDLTDPTADPYAGLPGMPDGYTRWWNPVEFANPSMPIFGYTHGKVATSGYKASATLNPFKYFADGLTANGNLWQFLTSTNKNGVFSHGVTNTRNYYLRFPTPVPNVKFNYAVIANWKGTSPADHPANASEAVALSVHVTPDIYYVSPTDKGGNLILDIDVFDWDSTLNGGVMEDYGLIIESTVLSNPVAFYDMVPVIQGDHWYRYHIEIPADNVTGVNGNEFWVILEDANLDYSNPFGVTNQADGKLAAFFRYDLYVSPTGTPNTPPVITGITDDIPPSGLNTIVKSSDTAVTYIAEFTDPDPGQTHTIKWYIEDNSQLTPSDPPDSMPYNWAPKSAGQYKIWVKVSDGFDEVTSGPYAITRKPDAGPGWARTWGGTGADDSWGITIDSEGNVYVAGYFNHTVDFDPGPGEDKYTSTGPNGWDDSYISKFDSSGNFKWVRVWSSTVSCFPFAAVTDSADNVYMVGWFGGTFDADPDKISTDWRPSAGNWDIYLVKVSKNGAWLWTKTWGGASADLPSDMAIDDYGNIYIAGAFWETSDFDPGPGQVLRTSKGSGDCFLAKYNSNGEYQWVRTWGGPDESYTGDRCEGVDTDGSSSIYTTGTYSATVNFDPNGSPGGPWEFVANGEVDVFLSKFDLQGNFKWATVWGSPVYDLSGGVAVAASEGVYVAGGVFGCADLDPSPSVFEYCPVGGWDSFISKFDTQGNFIWGRGWGGQFADEAYYVTSDQAGNAYVTGRFEGYSGYPPVDFNPDPIEENLRASGGGYDCFVNVFSPYAEHLWVATWGGPGTQDCRDGVIDESGAIYVSGMFNGTTDFDPGPGVWEKTDNGYVDAFVNRILFGGTW